MEDIFSVAYQQTDDEKDLEYAFFGIFDGHGGREAAQFAKVICQYPWTRGAPSTRGVQRQDLRAYSVA